MSFHIRSERVTIACAMLALVTACGGRPTNEKIGDMIVSSPRFQAPLTAYVPRRIRLVPQAVSLPNGGETVDAYNPYFRTLKVDAYSVAHLSAPAAVLWAAGVVDVADAASVRTLTTKPATPATESVDEEGRSYVVEPAHDAHTFDAYSHVLTVRRRDNGNTDWVEDKVGPQNPPNRWYRESTTPGWVVTLAHRRFVRIDTILDNTSVNEEVAPDELLVQFTYAWDPTPTGQAFVPGSDAYEDLPESVKYYDPLEGGPLRFREQHAHLVLKRTTFGWEVARIGRDWRDAGGVNGPM